MAAMATDRRRIVPLPLFWFPSTSSNFRPRAVVHVVTGDYFRLRCGPQESKLNEGLEGITRGQGEEQDERSKTQH